ncbi:hypothetical protein BURMUCF2_3212 [Burkholderia multivorans CF2]|nr:hypothetical protein BURMUCF2_3212 [Burkholderia multivorans CF2]
MRGRPFSLWRANFGRVQWRTSGRPSSIGRRSLPGLPSRNQAGIPLPVEPTLRSVIRCRFCSLRLPACSCPN